MSVLEFDELLLHPVKTPIESIADNTRQVLVYVLKQIIILLNPFAPFITDEIYQAIPNTLKSINYEKWPTSDGKYLNEEVISEMDSIIEVITAVRSIRNTEGIANIPLINGSRVVENIARQTITAPNAYLLLVNPKLKIVSLFEFSI